jgi:hypothetical protein
MGKRMNRQHEVLRVPNGWTEQDKALIMQLERIHDDLYNRLTKAVTGQVFSVLGIEPDEDGNVALTKDSILGLGLGLAARENIAFVEDGDTASRNISAGQYVVWNGDLYTASVAIASGDTLSSSNLTEVSNGGLNDLKLQIKEDTWRGYQTKEYNVATGNIAAGANKGFTASDFKVSTPSGYTPVGVVRFSCSSQYISVIQVDGKATGSNVMMRAFNWSSAQRSGNVYITILYLQTGSPS